MKNIKRADPTRIRIWTLFADQFLDTETRTEIPRVALAAVEAGYSVGEAESIWRHEVTPVVGPNLWSVAGEWACWPEDWLVERIEASRAHLGRPGWLTDFIYRIESWPLSRPWQAIRELMRYFERLPASERSDRCAELTCLAAIYFDFCAKPLADNSASRKAELRALYESTFLPILGPLAVHCSVTHESPKVCRDRVEASLAPNHPKRRGAT